MFVRDRSVQLLFDEPGVRIFDILAEKNIQPADLLGVQSLPGLKYDVTFRTQDLRRRFWPSLEESRNFKATSYGDHLKVVTVLHAPVEMEETVIKYVLEKYGRIRHYEHLRYSFPMVLRTELN